MQWDSLRLIDAVELLGIIFLSNFDLDDDPTEDDPDKKPNRAKSSVNAFKQLVSSWISCSSSLYFQYLIA